MGAPGSEGGKQKKTDRQRERGESGDGWARMHHSLGHMDTLRNKTTACKLNNNNNKNKQTTNQTNTKKDQFGQCWLPACL